MNFGKQPLILVQNGLKTPIPKTGGTAILVPGQYKNTYRIAKHKGEYLALCQRSNKNVKVWRDNNKDNILDWEGEPKPGVFGINIHRANEEGKTIKVDWHSAGCQVIANIKDFNRMMKLANTQKTENKGDTFTYTLLTEEEVDEVTKPSK